jgi:hypothetical protein
MRLTDNYTLVLRADYSNPAGFWWAIPEVMVPAAHDGLTTVASDLPVRPFRPPDDDRSSAFHLTAGDTG